MRPRLLVASLALPLLIVLPALALRAEEPPEPAPATAEQIEELARQLGASDFETRERASRELLRIGEPAREALERTMRESENLEARWRAEQIIRRLDHEGAQPVRERPRQEPPSGPDPSGDRLWELLRQRLEEQWREFGLGGAGVRLEAPGLALEILPPVPFPSVVLHVFVDETAPSPARGVYRGRSLEEILARHPELEAEPGMAELRRKWEEHQRRAASHFPFGPSDERPPGGTRLRVQTSSQGVEVVHDGDRVRVKVRERGEDGEEVVREYEGESLEQLRRDHPELRDKLGSFELSVRIGPPQVFERFRRWGRLPLPPFFEPPVTPSEEPRLGAQIQEPPPALAHHLRLEPGEGALVIVVEPGSQAERLGLRVYDVIVEIDGRPAGPYDEVAAALRRAAAEPGPLALGVIRAGQPLVLSR